VFTASHKWYADVIIDYIDPEKKYIQHRLYRDHCIKTTDNVYVKDLRVFKNRDLKDLLIVDNAVYSFGA
jgi:CTD small phosphatase-like protein 2